MDWTYTVGALATAVTAGANLPQLFKCWRTRDVRALSSKTLVALAAGLGLWVTYGIFRGDAMVIMGNVIAFAITAGLLALKARYG